MGNDTRLTLRSAGSTASIAKKGAELISWTVGNQEQIWAADPTFWARSAPILFPVIGASVNGAVGVSGQSYPMPRHGFARDSSFDLIGCGGNWAVLKLTDCDASRMYYPFPFSLSVRFDLSANSIRIDFDVSSRGEASMPYQLGFHPAFAWPLGFDRYENCKLIFSNKEPRPLFRLNSEGLLPHDAVAAIEGGVLPINAQLIEEGALIFPEHHSQSLTFTSQGGPHLEMSVDGFPHFAAWTKPNAPFLSIEAWAGLPDWNDANGQLAARAGINIAHPWMYQRHSVVLNHNAHDLPP